MFGRPWCIVGVIMSGRKIEAVERKDEMAELVKQYLSPESEYLDDAAIQWLLTGSNAQVRPERQWFMPFDESGEARIDIVLDWIKNDSQRFSDLTAWGELSAAAELSQKIRAGLLLFEYLIEASKLKTE